MLFKVIPDDAHPAAPGVEVDNEPEPKGKCESEPGCIQERLVCNDPSLRYHLSPQSAQMRLSETLSHQLPQAGPPDQLCRSRLLSTRNTPNLNYKTRGEAWHPSQGILAPNSPAPGAASVVG